MAYYKLTTEAFRWIRSICNCSILFSTYISWKQSLTLASLVFAQYNSNRSNNKM